MDGRMGHARAIGGIVAVCAVVALLLAMNFFFVLVLVYKAGWLTTMTSLVALSAAAVMLAVAEAYILARILGARCPELVSGFTLYCRENKFVAIGVVLALLVALRLAAARFVG
jgi:hypothetical protein